jgi:hypothetical protein
MKTRSALLRSLLLAAILLGGFQVLLVGAWRTKAAARTVTAPRPALFAPAPDVPPPPPEPARPELREEAAPAPAAVPRQPVEPVDPEASRRGEPAPTLRSLDPREVPAPVRERLERRLAGRR